MVQYLPLINLNAYQNGFKHMIFSIHNFEIKKYFYVSIYSESFTVEIKKKSLLRTGVNPPTPFFSGKGGDEKIGFLF